MQTATKGQRRMDSVATYDEIFDALAEGRDEDADAAFRRNAALLAHKDEILTSILALVGDERLSARLAREQADAAEAVTTAAEQVADDEAEEL